MDHESRAEVLKQISAIQKSTASVTVQIGGTSDSDGIVEHDALYLKDAPAKVVNELTGMGFSLSVTDGGVRVDDYAVE